MSNMIYTVQFKFLELGNSTIKTGLMTCIDYLELKKIGYKIYGRCSTFKTSRIEVSSTDIEKTRGILEDLKDIFSKKEYSIKAVLYSVLDDVVEIHRIIGERDDDMVSEIISVKNTSNPVN